VFEERRAREGWGDGVTPSFLEAFKADKLNPPSRLNESFLRPSYPEQVTHAYFQASLLMELINRDFGFDAITAFLKGYRNGSTTEELVVEILDMSFEDLDDQFVQYVEDTYGDSIKAITDDSPSGYQSLIKEARASVKAGDLTEAEDALVRAQGLYPHFGGERSSYRQLAALYQDSGRIDDAIDQLKQNLLHAAGDFTGYRLLADLYHQQGNNKLAAQTLEDSLYVNPFEADVYVELARLHGLVENWPAVAQARSSVVALGSSDPIEARYLLARALTDMGDYDRAKNEILATLELAPLYEQALELLLEVRDKNQSQPAAENKTDG